MVYTLRHGDITACVNTLGAELCSLQKSGHEYIWTGDPAYWNGHNPTLFPVIGFLKDDTTCFNGIEYSIPKHGYARKTEFTLVQYSENSITLQMTDSEETRSGFPFFFCLQITHTLTDDGYETLYRVENRSDQIMHFMLGAHTGFLLPFTKGSSFEDHTLIFERPESNVVRYTAVNGKIIENTAGVRDFLDGADRLRLSYELFDDDALMLTGLSSQKVALLDREGRGVGMEFAGFDALGIWTPPGKHAPFLCLEPWNGINAFANEKREFSQKPYLRSTPAGGNYSISYRVHIID